MKIIFLQVKRHIDNPARLISMCLDEKFNKTLYNKNPPPHNNIWYG